MSESARQQQGSDVGARSLMMPYYMVYGIITGLQEMLATTMFFYWMLQKGHTRLVRVARFLSALGGIAVLSCCASLVLMRLCATFGNTVYRMSRRRSQVYWAALAVIALIYVVAFIASADRNETHVLMAFKVTEGTACALWFGMATYEFVSRLILLVTARHRVGSRSRASSPASASEEDAAKLRYSRRTISNFESSDHAILQLATKQTTLAMIICFCMMFVFYIEVPALYRNSLCLNWVIFLTRCLFWLAGTTVSVCFYMSFAHSQPLYVHWCSRLHDCVLKMTLYFAQRQIVDDIDNTTNSNPSA